MSIRLERGVAHFLLSCATLIAALAPLACGGHSETASPGGKEQAPARGLTSPSPTLPITIPEGNAPGAVATARSCLVEHGYAISAEDSQGFVVSTRDGLDESRVDGHTLLGGDPYLVASIALDADPDFRADVHEC